MIHTKTKMSATGVAKETVEITSELQYFTACYKKSYMNKMNLFQRN